MSSDIDDCVVNKMMVRCGQRIYNTLIVFSDERLGETQMLQRSSAGVSGGFECFDLTPSHTSSDFSTAPSTLERVGTESHRSEQMFLPKLNHAVKQYDSHLSRG
jgi:hypothetical protein